MKRILLASPVRGGLSVSYVRALFALYFSKLNKVGGGPDAPFDFEWATTSGTSVAMARDHLADLCIKSVTDQSAKPGFHGMVFWDVDLGAASPSVTLDMFARLLSHDVDIVAGQYVGHNFISEFHGATIDGSKGPDASGLMEMTQIPLGFSFISTRALLQIKERLPWHRYAMKETGERGGKPEMFEFFPNGVVGPNSAEGKLGRIKDFIKQWESHEIRTHEELLNRIIFTADDKDYSTNIMLGEDYYFCKLARDAGLKLHIDNNLIIPHETSVRLPVDNGKILAALSEPWRLANDATPMDVANLIERLRVSLSEDIP